MMNRNIQIREDGYHGNLEEAVAMMDNWPTPATRDWKGSSPGAVIRKDGKSRMDLLDYMAEQSQFGPQAPTIQTDGNESSENGQTLPPPSPKRLNPGFVEWMMGLPQGWTEDSVPLETGLFRRWQRALGRLLTELSEDDS